MRFLILKFCVFCLATPQEAEVESCCSQVKAEVGRSAPPPAAPNSASTQRPFSAENAENQVEVHIMQSLD